MHYMCAVDVRLVCHTYRVPGGQVLSKMLCIGLPPWMLCIVMLSNWCFKQTQLLQQLSYTLCLNLPGVLAVSEGPVISAEIGSCLLMAALISMLTVAQRAGA